MKLITETLVRQMMKVEDFGRLFEVPCGSLLTPAARDYLTSNKITVSVVGKRAKSEKSASTKILKKSEFNTHLSGKNLVYKDDSRIELRGKLDSLQAQILSLMLLAQKEQREKLLGNLKDVLACVGQILTAEVLDQSLPEISLFGYDDAELRDRSHHSMKYYGVKVLQLPDISFGEIYIGLNLIRCRVRETEIVAVKAFKSMDDQSDKRAIVQALNRLSSAVHVLMCEELSNGAGDEQG